MIDQPSTDKVEIFRADNGEFSWRRLNGENGKVVSGPEETFKNKLWVVRSAHTLNRDVPEENFKDFTEADPIQGTDDDE